MNGIEDRVTSLLTWGLPLGALAFCASLVLAWFGAPDGFWRGFWEGAAAVLFETFEIFTYCLKSSAVGFLFLSH